MNLEFAAFGRLEVQAERAKGRPAEIREQDAGLRLGDSDRGQGADRKRKAGRGRLGFQVSRTEMLGFGIGGRITGRRCPAADLPPVIAVGLERPAAISDMQGVIAVHAAGIPDVAFVPGQSRRIGGDQHLIGRLPGAFGGVVHEPTE